MEQEKKEKYYCANCAHCIVIRYFDADRDKYFLRVRCRKKHWIKRSGEEKLYKYFTVARRQVEGCPDYTPMGPLIPYIKNLRKELPVKDEVYYLKK